MAKSDLAVTIRCDVQPFVDGELMIAKRMNELVDAVNRANRQPASGLGAAVAGALVRGWQHVQDNLAAAPVQFWPIAMNRPTGG